MGSCPLKAKGAIEPLGCALRDRLEPALVQNSKPVRLSFPKRLLTDVTFDCGDAFQAGSADMCADQGLYSRRLFQEFLPTP